MAWRTSTDNSINCPKIPDAWRSRIVSGSAEVGNAISQALVLDSERFGRPVFLALDGFKGVKFGALLNEVVGSLGKHGLEAILFNINAVFRSQPEISEIIKDHERSEDPAFGRVYPGEIHDFVDSRGMEEMLSQWDVIRSSGRRLVIICHGVGAALPARRFAFDRIAYLDITREQIIVRSEKNEVPPLGSDSPNGWPWKRIYYVEYPVLNRHKKSVLQIADWYVDSSRGNEPLLVPGLIYHALLTELSGMPVAFKVFYMPGTFGGTEFAKRFHVDGLSNTSWDYEISVGDNHLLVAIGDGRILEMPFYNLLWEQPLRFLGSYCCETYPGHFPIAIYMQDGCFPPETRLDFKRTHMPNHSHPDTAYCREHFNEPLGRYETYYIVRADPGAVTMHGFHDDADIDEYIREIQESEKTGREFDWRKYIYEHPSKTGELHQLPPGTVHGTGGRQIILEIDTNPSRESTEYSFYLYDYCRPNFNYEKGDFTGRAAKLHLGHALAQLRRNRKQKFMARHLRPGPVCLRRGADWREMSFPMYYNMPYQVNRLEFETVIEDDTNDQFHCLSLTAGSNVRVSSKRDPSKFFLMEDCDSIVIPASFGEYICENKGGGSCEVVKVFLIAEPRDHIDRISEEACWSEGSRGEV